MLKINSDLISCCHIYRERNVIVDALSKEGAQQNRGTWMIIEQHGSEHFEYYPKPFIKDFILADVEDI